MKPEHLQAGRFVALAAAITCALVLTPHAKAAFTPPETLAKPRAASPQVAVAPDGTATAVWLSVREIGKPSRTPRLSTQLKAAIVERNGRAGPTVTLARSQGRRLVHWPGLPDGAVGVDAKGRATVAWTETTRRKQWVRARRLHDDGQLGPVRELGTIRPPDVRHTPQVAADPRGRAIVGWVDPNEDEVRAVQLSGSGKPGPAFTVSEAGGPSTAAFDLAIDPQGHATVVWQTTGSEILSRRIGPSGDPEPVRTLGVGSISQAAVGVDPEGRATVTWSEAGRGVLARRLDASGNPEPEQVLTSEESSGAPLIGVDFEGAATVAWDRSTCCPATNHLEAVRLSAAGDPGPIRTITSDEILDPSGDTFVRFDLATSANGRTAVAWRDIDDGRIRATHLGPDGIPQGPEPVARMGRGTRFVDVAVDADGRATVVWHESYPKRRSRVLLSQG